MKRKAVIIFSVGVVIIGVVTYAISSWRKRKQLELDEAASAELSENNIENLNAKLKDLEAKLKSATTSPVAKKTVQAEIKKVEEAKKAVVITTQDRVAQAKQFKKDDKVMLTKAATAPIGLVNQNGSFTQLIATNSNKKQTKTLPANVFIGTVHYITTQGGVVVKLPTNEYVNVVPSVLKKV
jgi:undecaprenyl pyrophosphate synthase